MKRAVIKNRQGDVVRGPIAFQDDADLARFTLTNQGDFARVGQQIVELPPSFLSAVQSANLRLLETLANQANGIVKHFQPDRDLLRRGRNLRPTKADIKLAADAIRACADLLEELAAKEYKL
jgi:hypothetical protein